MAATDDVLRILEARRGETVSGEGIAGQLGLSRAAVWKAVTALRDRGFGIEALSNRGYTLVSDRNRLHPETIRPHLRTREALDLRVYDRVEGSTNDLVRGEAAAGAPEGLAVIADTQTGGKGRQGRSFLSPPGTGVYMSLLLRPVMAAEQAVAVTAAAAVAVCRAIEDLGGGPGEIKWVNDLLSRGRKLCGILAEGVLREGKVQSVVLGIGINTAAETEDFPPELRETATSVYLETGAAPDRAALAAALLRELDALAEAYPRGRREVWTEYRARCVTLGKAVTLTDGTEGTAEDLGADFSLLVRLPDGALRRLRSGEASLHGRG